MSEIRIKQKTLAIGVGLTVLLLLYFASRGPKCPPSAEFQDLKMVSKDQQVDKVNEESESFTIYAITPTYTRPVQKAELTRLAQTLLQVRSFFWIIIEDEDFPSDLVRNVLKSTNMLKRSKILYVKTPVDFKLKKKDPNWLKPRGVAQRNLGLEYVRKVASSEKRSTVYFLDDDNTYSLDLFEEIKKVEPGKVGVWPVGLVGGLSVERPVLDNENRVLGFNSVWRPERPFPLDMAGFAISTDLLLRNPEAKFSYEVERGYQKSEILRYLVVVRDLQPLANLCSKVYVWHTRTENPKLDAEAKLRKEGQRSDFGIEV